MWRVTRHYWTLSTVHFSSSKKRVNPLAERNLQTRSVCTVYLWLTFLIHGIIKVYAIPSTFRFYFQQLLLNYVLKFICSFYYMTAEQSEEDHVVSGLHALSACKLNIQKKTMCDCYDLSHWLVSLNLIGCLRQVHKLYYSISKYSNILKQIDWFRFSVSKCTL